MKLMEALLEAQNTGDMTKVIELMEPTFVTIELEKVQRQVGELSARLEVLSLSLTAIAQQIESGQIEQTVAEAVLETLKNDVLIAQIVQKTVEAVEAEWTGKFLPELRRTNQADLREALAQSGSQ